MRQFVFAAAAAIALFALASTPAYPEGPNDQAALSGLSEVKVAFDVTNGDGKTLLKALEVIDETKQSLIKQGVKPHFVIAFRGPATKLVQKDQNQIKAEDREYAAKIAEKINALRSADGVTSIEQCAVAVRLAGTKPDDLVPGVKLVGNGWISLMAYEAKGYGYIAP
jgi:intracellular sulfur oxidation DsrE/DsrF family protein